MSGTWIFVTESMAFGRSIATLGGITLLKIYVRVHGRENRLSNWPVDMSVGPFS